MNGEEAIVRYTYDYNPSSGKIVHLFESLLLENYTEPEDPTLGFLQPNINSPEGEIFIHFTVDPSEDLEHLDNILNKAYIYFDNNDVIITNNYLNVVDTIAPVSTILPLPTTQIENDIVLHLEGSDDQALLKDFIVQMSVNDGPWINIATAMNIDSLVVTGELGNQYEFKVRARDYANNLENEHENPDAVVTIVTHIPEGQSGNWKVYPNPVQSTLTVEVPFSLQDGSIELFDALGRKVYSNSTRSVSRIQIPMESIPAGIYQVIYRNSEGTFAAKVIRE
jgi:hypothetical protein